MNIIDDVRGVADGVLAAYEKKKHRERKAEKKYVVQK